MYSKVISCLVVFLAVAKGTIMHVNAGCIVVHTPAKGNMGLCAGDSGHDIGVSGSLKVGGRLLDDQNLDITLPGCIAYWNWNPIPRSGEVWYGEDNKFYDANGNNIDGQSCDETKPGTSPCFEEECAVWQPKNPYKYGSYDVE